MDNKEDIENSSSTRKIIFFLGPILASFHVATYIVGFFSVGAVAKWITDQWFPFTRWVWTEISIFIGDYIELPELSIVEKDALTTLVFFLPLGVYAIFFRKQHPLDDRYKKTAVFIGFFFLIVVGMQLIRTVFGTLFNFENGYLPRTGLGWFLFATMFILLYLGNFTSYMETAAKGEEKNVKKDNEVKQKEPFVLRLAAFLIVLIMTNLLIVIVENLFNLSLVTSTCFVLVLFFAFTSVLRTPYRLSWGLGSLIAFVLSGLIFELIIILVDFIQALNLENYQ